MASAANSPRLALRLAGLQVYNRLRLSSADKRNRNPEDLTQFTVACNSVARIRQQPPSGGFNPIHSRLQLGSPDKAQPPSGGFNPIHSRLQLGSPDKAQPPSGGFNPVHSRLQLGSPDKAQPPSGGFNPVHSRLQLGSPDRRTAPPPGWSPEARFTRLSINNGVAYPRAENPAATSAADSPASDKTAAPES